MRFTGLPTSNVTSDENYVELKRFVNRICQEVLEISNKFDFSQNNSKQDEVPPAFDPKTYEQLVATAVLNKVKQLQFSL